MAKTRKPKNELKDGGETDKKDKSEKFIIKKVGDFTFKMLKK